MAKIITDLTIGSVAASVQRERQIFGDILVAGGWTKVYSTIDWTTLNATMATGTSNNIGYEIFRSDDEDDVLKNFYIKLVYIYKTDIPNTVGKWVFRLGIGWELNLAGTDFGIPPIMSYSVELPEFWSQDYTTTTGSINRTTISAGKGWVTCFDNFNGAGSNSNAMSFSIERIVGYNNQLTNNVSLVYNQHTNNISNGTGLGFANVVSSWDDKVVYSLENVGNTSIPFLFMRRNTVDYNQIAYNNKMMVGNMNSTTYKSNILTNIVLIGNNVSSTWNPITLKVNGENRNYLTGHPISYYSGNGIPERLLAYRFE